MDLALVNTKLHFRSFVCSLKVPYLERWLWSCCETALPVFSGGAVARPQSLRVQAPQQHASGALVVTAVDDGTAPQSQGLLSATKLPSMSPGPHAAWEPTLELSMG